MAYHDKPTPNQLRELRRLAHATGTTFSPPRTRGEASRSIAALRQRETSSGVDLALDRRRVADGLQRGTLATTPQPDEIHGYGSTARWASGHPPEAA